MALGKDGIDPSVNVHKNNRVVPVSEPLAAPAPPGVPANAAVNVPVDAPVETPTKTPVRLDTVATFAEMRAQGKVK